MDDTGVFAEFLKLIRLYRGESWFWLVAGPLFVLIVLAYFAAFRSVWNRSGALEMGRSISTYVVKMRRSRRKSVQPVVSSPKSGQAYHLWPEWAMFVLIMSPLALVMWLVNASQ